MLKEEYLNLIKKSKPSMPGLKKKCSVCGKEFGVLSYDEMDTDVFCSDECRHKHILQQRAMSAIREIPAKFLRYKTKKQDTLEKVYKDKTSVFCYGSVGTGKSVFAANLVKRYIMDGASAKWISYPAFIMELRNRFAKEDKEETAWDIAEEVAGYRGVLVLDDLGAERLTDFVREITYYILNEREQEELTTIITSNLSLAQLDEIIDPRISSRIAGMCRVLKFTGADMRVNKEAK